jgi:hypothetical protein
MKNKKNKNQQNSLKLVSSDDNVSVYSTSNLINVSRNNNRSAIVEIIVEPFSIEEFVKLSESLERIYKKREVQENNEIKIQ